MRVSRLFTDQPLNINDSVFLDEKQSHYIRHVLRLKSQQPIILFNGYEELDYHACILKIGKKVELQIENRVITQKEPPIKITLFQALSKNEHCDLTIQKCTELGVSSIIIFNSQRTQIPLKSSKIEKKLMHWKRIAQSACEQSGRSIVPTIEFISRFDSTLEHPASSQRIMLDFEGLSIKQELEQLEIDSIDLLLGPEGGLTTEEITLAHQHKFNKVRLGPRVLRTETAAITAVSLIQMLAGDLN